MHAWAQALPFAMGQSLGKPLFSMAFTSDTTLRPCSRIQAIGRNFSFGRAKEVLRSMQAGEYTLEE